VCNTHPPHINIGQQVLTATVYPLSGGGVYARTHSQLTWLSWQ